jgi:hypothetical protein
MSFNNKLYENLASATNQTNKQTHKQEVVTGGCKFKIMRVGAEFFQVH